MPTYARTHARPPARTHSPCPVHVPHACCGLLCCCAAHRPGAEVLLYDGRPNGELMLCTGAVEESNPSDFTTFKAALLGADKYYAMKAQILESLGLGPTEAFPVYNDRMPVQLFNYLRLARVADPALFAKVRCGQPGFGPGFGPGRLHPACPILRCAACGMRHAGQLRHQHGVGYVSLLPVPLATCCWAWRGAAHTDDDERATKIGAARHRAAAWVQYSVLCAVLCCVCADPV